MKSPWNHHETSPVSALSPSIPSARAGHSALPPTTLCPPRFPRGWSLVPRPKIHPILDGENRPKITSELVGFQDTEKWPKELGKNPMEMVIVCYSYLPGSSLYGRCTHCSRIWIPRWSVGITCQKIFPGQIKMSWDITQLWITMVIYPLVSEIALPSWSHKMRGFENSMKRPPNGPHHWYLFRF